MPHSLAQANATLTRHPFDHPKMADLTRRIDTINALAAASPGFIRRVTPQTDADLKLVGRWLDSTDTHRIFFNMSVWESIESLRDFTYRTQHQEVIGRKKDWIVPRQGPGYVLWWISAGTTPSVAEACHRLQQLRSSGPSPTAFDFGSTYQPAG